jgi:hypothetical protein
VPSADHSHAGMSPCACAASRGSLALSIAKSASLIAPF